MGFPLCVTCCFPLAAFGTLSFCLVFVGLTSLCLGVFLLGFILYGTLCASWTCFLFHIGEIFNHNLQKFSHTLSFSLLLGPLLFYCRCIWYCPRGFWDYPQFFFFFILFTLFCSWEVISTILSSSSLICSSASDILLLIPSRAFSISVTVLFVSLCLFFNFIL